MLPDLQTLTASLVAVSKGNGWSNGEVTVVERQPNLYSSSYLSEIVTCELDDGRTLRLFCKYDIRQRQSSLTREGSVTFCKPSPLYGRVEYEATIHRHILQPLGTFPLKFYGAHTDAGTGHTWLVLEYLNKSVPVDDIEDAFLQGEALGLAARWIGQFHAASEARLSSGSMPLIDKYDAAYYVQWARQTLASTAHLHESYAWLPIVCQRFEELADHLLAQPPTVIHGDYYCDNTLFREGLVYPIDWGCAAIAAGELDLAMLTFNWPEDTARHCELEYQRARWPTGPPAEFVRTLNAARLFLCFRALWEKPDWVNSERPPRRFELLRSMSARAGLI